MPTITEVFADYVLEGRGSRDHLIPCMQVYALDTLAVTLGGSSSASSQPMIDVLLEAAGKREATIIGVGRVTSAWDAALGNGAFAHALELDDDHRTAVLHPGAVVVPAAFACAEAEGVSGKEFLEALYVGYELMCRLGEVFKGSQFYHGVHPTALCGVFGAAAASACLARLDQRKFVAALGIAGTQASGLTEWKDGSWIKRLHPGRAAQSGVIAARLARRGFTGPASILEGEGGFFRAYSFGEAIDQDAMVRALGERHCALETAIKPYPCCRFEHGVIDLAIEAYNQGIQAADIRAVSVRIFRTGVLSYHHHPKSVVDAQFNVPYAVAIALLRGRVSLSDFTSEAVQDAEVRSLCCLIDVQEDDDCTAAYPEEYRVKFDLLLRSGKKYSTFSNCPTGDPAAAHYRADSALLWEETKSKAKRVLTETGFADRADALIEKVEALPDAMNVDGLADILGGQRSLPSKG